MKHIPEHVQRQMMTEPRFVFLVADRDREILDRYGMAAERVIDLKLKLKDLGPYEFLYYSKAV